MKEKMTTLISKQRQYLLQLLARRDYSRAELRQKALLYAKRISPEESFDLNELEQLLDELAANQWQSDERFVETFVRYQSQRGQGALKIQQALKQKGVSETLIRDALNNIDWLEVAQRVYVAKYDTKPKTPTERAKRQRFLAQRGFSFSIISKIL